MPSPNALARCLFQIEAEAFESRADLRQVEVSIAPLARHSLDHGGLGFRLSAWRLLASAVVVSRRGAVALAKFGGIACRRAPEHHRRHVLQLRLSPRDDGRGCSLHCELGTGIALDRRPKIFSFNQVATYLRPFTEVSSDCVEAASRWSRNARNFAVFATRSACSRLVISNAVRGRVSYDDDRSRLRIAIRGLRGMGFPARTTPPNQRSRS